MAENYKLIMSVDEMSKDQKKWLELRTQGIGGSDVAAVMGMSKWKSPIEVWAEKTGQVVDHEPDEAKEERFHFGHVLEAIVANEFEERTGLKLRKQGLIRSTQYEWALADVDRMIVGKPWLLECKTADSWRAEEYEGDNIPVQYYLQIQWYLFVTGCEKAYIAILFGGNHFMYKEVPRNDEDINAMVTACKDFWENNVATKTPPPADSSEMYSSYLSQNTKYQDNAVLDMPSDMELKVKDILALEEQIRVLKEQVDLKKNQIREQMIDYCSAVSSIYRVSYRTQNRTMIDSAMLKKDYPEVYKNVSGTKSYRSLRITAHPSAPNKKYNYDYKYLEDKKNKGGN